MKGEELGAVSLETQVPVHELERWRRIFLEGATNGFKRRDTPGTHERYPVTLLCEALHAARSSVYGAGVATSPTDGGKRGPKTALTDYELVGEIRAVLATCPFHSEGHRKVHFRLRAKEIRVGRKRVLRLMRAHHLLAPSRPRHEHGDPAHAGTIITRVPTRCGGRTRRVSTPSGRGGAGSSGRSITTRPR